MPTKPWMRQDSDLPAPAALPEPTDRTIENEPRGFVEIGLALAGVAAWVWCAFEVARTLFR